MPGFLMWGIVAVLLGFAGWYVVARMRPTGPERLNGADMPTLQRALSDGNPAVRARAASLLGKLGAKAKSTMPSLVNTVKDNDPNVSLSGAMAIVKIDPSDSSTAVPVLAGALTNHDFSVRREAAEGLGKIGPQAKGAVAALVAALKDSNNIIRRVAAESLGRIGQEAGDAAAPLMEALEDKDEKVRAAAKRAIDKIALN